MNSYSATEWVRATEGSLLRAPYTWDTEGQFLVANFYIEQQGDVSITFSIGRGWDLVAMRGGKLDLTNVELPRSPDELVALLNEIRKAHGL